MLVFTQLVSAALRPRGHCDRLFIDIKTLKLEINNRSKCYFYDLYPQYPSPKVKAKNEAPAFAGNQLFIVQP
jgi:hypothetical protein